MSQPTSTHYRETVANFPSGVTVVTTRDSGEDFGLTVSAFTSLSLDPPMVLVSIDRKSKSHQHLVEGRAHRHFRAGGGPHRCGGAIRPPR